MGNVFNGFALGEFALRNTHALVILRYGLSAGCLS